MRKLTLMLVFTLSLLISGCAEKKIYIQPNMPVLKEYNVPKLKSITYEIRPKVQSKIQKKGN